MDAGRHHAVEAVLAAAALEAVFAAIVLLWATMLAVAYAVWRGRGSPMIANIPTSVWKWGFAVGLVGSALICVAVAVLVI